MNKIKKTKKLYDNDAYATEFQAKVLSCKEVVKNGKVCYEVILDQSLFFPEEGGQTPDRGTINGAEVIDVQIRDDVLFHYILTQSQQTKGDNTNGDVADEDSLRKANDELNGINEGALISAQILWTHRFSNMQQHSAEHIFSGLVYKEYGYRNVGFHLSDNIVTMDFDGVLTHEQTQDLEWKVNEAIVRNVKVKAYYPDVEELKGLEYRSKMEIEGPVRIVTIDGYDTCACCAPHVKRTGEIGMFKVMSVQSHRGGVRISFLCGFRALNAFREKAKILSSITDFLTTGQDKALERISQLKDSNVALKNQIGLLKQDVLLGKIKEIPIGQKNAVLIEEDVDTVIARNAVNAMVERYDGKCAVFAGNDMEGYRFILGSKLYDCREIAANMRNLFGAKCGGSKEMIQGSLEAKQDKILRFFE